MSKVEGLPVRCGESIKSILVRPISFAICCISAFGDGKFLTFRNLLINSTWTICGGVAMTVSMTWISNDRPSLNTGRGP